MSEVSLTLPSPSPSTPLRRSLLQSSSVTVNFVVLPTSVRSLADVARLLAPLVNTTSGNFRLSSITLAAKGTCGNNVCEVRMGLFFRFLQNMSGWRHLPRRGSGSKCTSDCAELQLLVETGERPLLLPSKLDPSNSWGRERAAGVSPFHTKARYLRHTSEHSLAVHFL